MGDGLTEPVRTICLVLRGIIVPHEQMLSARQISAPRALKVQSDAPGGFSTTQVPPSAKFGPHVRMQVESDPKMSLSNIVGSGDKTILTPEISARRR